MLGNSRVAERLAASQEGLSSMELVTTVSLCYILSTEVEQLSVAPSNVSTVQLLSSYGPFEEP
jgi:hypothetical protein